MHNQSSLDHPKQENLQPDLGLQIDCYPVHRHKLKQWLEILLGGFFIFTSMLLLVFLIFKTSLRVSSHGRAMILTIIPYPLILYALLFITGFLLVTAALVHWKDRIELYELGFVQHRAKRQKTWLFEETERFDSYITQIMFGGSLVTTKVKIHLENKASEHWVIHTSYTRMMDLVENLRQHLLPNLIQKNLQHLSDGATLFFHPHFQLTEQGLHIKGDFYPFNEIQSIVNNQHIRIIRSDTPSDVLFKTQNTKIRNLDMLLEMLENPPYHYDPASPK